MNITDDDDRNPRSSTEATVAVQTVGCKLNQAESESLTRSFLDCGYEIVSPDGNPDVFILNTCTVTHIADRKCRQYLRNFRRRNPNSLILAIGCYADRDFDGLSQLEGVDLAIGNAEKGRIVEIVRSRLNSRGMCGGGNGHHALSSSVFRTRSMIKIQGGCSHRCSYCIVPSVRGHEYSVPAGTVLAEIKARVDEGYKEVVLTGTRIGSYGCAGGLEGLVRRILDETAVARLRLSSLQPGELTSSLIRLWRDNERVCRHLHLALQCGSDSVLSRMNRGYSVGEYRDAVNVVREAMPDMAITTDIIVGFPGETEAEFQESYRFCESTGFADLHIFPYSARPGTLASRMVDKVPEKVKKDRSQAMLGLAHRSAQNFRRRFEGEMMPVLWEERKGNRRWIGHTSNYIKVFTESDEPLTNLLMETKLGTEYEDALWGDILNKHEKRPVGQRRMRHND